MAGSDVRSPARTRIAAAASRPCGRPPSPATFSGATHCGAGCALGDLVGDTLGFLLGLAVFGSALAGHLLLAFAFAYLFGIVFQFLSVAPMQGLGLRDGLVAAVKIDTLSLLACQLGMFAVMVLVSRIWPALEPNDPAYWLVMQGAMLVGFATTYPVNWWLIARGTKEKM